MATNEDGCKHEDFRAGCRVARLTDGEDGPVTHFMLEVHVRCAECGQEFGFLGPPAGIRFDGPTVTPDGFELTCPIVPGPVPRLGTAIYELPGSRAHHDA